MLDEPVDKRCSIEPPKAGKLMICALDVSDAAVGTGHRVARFPSDEMGP